MDQSARARKRGLGALGGGAEVVAVHGAGFAATIPPPLRQTAPSYHFAFEMHPMIAVIDYDAGNAPSVIAALDHIGETAQLVSSAAELQSASAIILPGVGSAGATMSSLAQLGLIDALLARMQAGTPFLGICVGLQILFEHSEEDDVACLGWFPGRVRRFSDELRVPQIGWNAVTRTRPHPLLEGLEPENYFYFVNSYYVAPSSELVLGQANYGVPFAAMVSRDNVHATQFHAEKSGPLGLRILKNFVSRRG